jgi:hypothetical protein
VAHALGTRQRELVPQLREPVLELDVVDAAFLQPIYRGEVFLDDQGDVARSFGSSSRKSRG